jgi:hypothetical protein
MKNKTKWEKEQIKKEAHVLNGVLEGWNDENTI